MTSAGELRIGAQALRNGSVPLLDRAVAGTFAERLFYRLRIIHFMAGAGLPEFTRPRALFEMDLKDVSTATHPL